MNEDLYCQDIRNRNIIGKIRGLSGQSSTRTSPTGEALHPSTMYRKRRSDNIPSLYLVYNLASSFSFPNSSSHSLLNS